MDSEFARLFKAAIFERREQDDGPAFRALLDYCQEHGIEKLGIAGMTLAPDPHRDN